MSDNPLGKNTAYPEAYSPDILFSIPRQSSSPQNSLTANLSMHGVDHWHAYELSWLSKSGKPEVAIGDFFFTSDSLNLVESKSLKLYLNGLNHSQFNSWAELTETLSRDLAKASGAKVEVQLHSPDHHQLSLLSAPVGKCLDEQQISVNKYKPEPLLLSLHGDKNNVVEECVYSNLFRSNCPVTAQPDWATVKVEYRGQQINHAGLLAYLCSFRNHQGFHEECAERIFWDVIGQCKPERLLISMNYLRRGGLDINCYRSTQALQNEDCRDRFVRQ